MSEQFERDNIRALSDREKAREKLPVFYGSRDGLYQGFMEVLNNGVDEVLNNFDKGIVEVILHDDNQTITVIDSGRGIPIDNEANIKLIFETLFASGKYDVSSKTSTGVNGVGTCVLMYSSEYFKCVSCLNGQKYEVEYFEGGLRKNGVNNIGSTDKHGTEITFKLDKDCYTNTTFNPEVIEEAIRRISMVSENITIIFKYKDIEKTFNNTIEEYFETYSKNIIGKPIIGKNKLYTKDIEVEKQGEMVSVKETAEIQLVMGTCVGEELLQETMLNGNYLKEHGSIYDGIIDGARYYINKHCRDNKLYKQKEKNLTNNDIISALSFACRLFSNIVEFESQVKFSTKKEYYKEVAREYTIEQLEIYSQEYKKDFDRMVEQVLICKRANETNEKAKQVLKKKLTEKVDGINGKVDGFVDCELEKGGELFLTEGNSALGSIVLARDSVFQAAYPLRGKMINALKNKLDKVIKNEEVIDILRLLGCGVETKSKYTKDLPTFDINNLRWDKIICTADADSDGRQINVLILTTLYKLVPTLIKEGYVYIALPPLFEIKVSDTEKYYALTITERDNIIKEKIGNRRYEVHRLKGLGETSKEVMAQTVCNPTTRIIQQVTVEDIKEMEKSFEKWMDTKVDERKEYIENNLHRYLIDAPIEDITEQKEITRIIEDNMMEYSADVIFDRAICSIESGLKPSQLRCLWAMYDKKIFKLTKSLNVVGEVTKFHSHGSSYPTIVNMTQEDRHSLPLITGEGNFGQYSSKLLTYASDRYTNVKLSPLAIDSLKEVDKNYVEMIPTYDNKNTMPLYLPSKYPIILTQASEGMAVGMASKLPSFNFNEVCEAIINYIKTGEQTMLIPDFATYGFIVNNKNTIETINKQGKGTLKLRGKCELNENNKTILIKEIPYGTYREDIIDKVIDLIKEGKLKEVISIKDSTGLKGSGIRVECRKNTNLKEVEQKLYKLTSLESTYSCNMNVLYNGMPSVQGVWGIIPKWIDFRKGCIIRSLKHEKIKLEKEYHLFKGFKNIINDLDKVIEIIRFEDEPINKLQLEFDLDELQAKYIFGLSLKDINKKYIEKKLQDISVMSNNIKELDITINSNDKLMNIIMSDLEYINKTYKSPRRTKIIDDIADTIEDILIEDYNLNIVLSKEGYLKKVKLTSLRGASEYKFKDGDSLLSLRQTSNKNDLLIFTNKQNCYKLKIHEIQDHKPSVLGLYLPSHLQLEEDEHIIDVIPTDYTEEILIAYENGKVARVPLSSYKTKTNRTKLSNATYSENIAGIHIYEDTKYILATEDKALIFKAKDIPLKTSRNTQGITVMKHSNMGKVVKFKKVSDCKLDTQSRYIAEGNGKAGRKIYSRDII